MSKTKAEYPWQARSSISLKIGKKIEFMAKEKNTSLAGVIRGIIYKHFELNPSEGINHVTKTQR